MNDLDIINSFYGWTYTQCINSPESTAKQLIDYLLENKFTIACAESCTGGLVSHFLTHIPGASEVFLEGVVSYSNHAKTSRLGVPSGLIKKYGAVSSEVAAAMAEGICTTSGADVGIATTGIAGPGGGSEDKPVGTVWVGVCTKDKVFTKQLEAKEGERAEIQFYSAVAALRLAAICLVNYPRINHLGLQFKLLT